MPAFFFFFIIFYNYKNIGIDTGIMFWVGWFLGNCNLIFCPFNILISLIGIINYIYRHLYFINYWFRSTSTHAINLDTIITYLYWITIIWYITFRFSLIVSLNKDRFGGHIEFMLIRNGKTCMRGILSLSITIKT